jgi:polysulfide reductase chain C
MWNWPIYIYLWLAGMAGGAFLCAFLVDRFSGGPRDALLKPATYVGVPMAVIGVLLLVVDLGQPIRFWRLMATFDLVSAMSVGTWILFFWVSAGVILIILWNIDRFVPVGDTSPGLNGIKSFLSWIGFVFSAMLMAYTGVLLASSNQPLWSATVILPSLFVASAVSTGVAALILAALVGGGVSRQTIMHLGEADAIVILIEMVMLGLFTFLLGGSTVAGAVEALGTLTSGPLMLWFWVGVVFLALLIPLGLEMASRGREAVGLIVTSSACVIIGGLILRAVVVIGGQM